MFKKEIQDKYEGIKENKDIPVKDNYNFTNRPLTIGETEAALQSHKANKSLGPDKIYTNLLMGGGNELLEAIHNLFQRSCYCRPENSSGEVLNEILKDNLPSNIIV